MHIFPPHGHAFSSLLLWALQALHAVFPTLAHVSPLHLNTLILPNVRLFLRLMQAFSTMLSAAHAWRTNLPSLPHIVHLHLNAPIWFYWHTLSHLTPRTRLFPSDACRARIMHKVAQCTNSLRPERSKIHARSDPKLTPEAILNLRSKRTRARILSRVLSGICFWHVFWHSFWHSNNLFHT